jgi:hypothetical protein
MSYLFATAAIVILGTSGYLNYFADRTSEASPQTQGVLLADEVDDDQADEVLGHGYQRQGAFICFDGQRIDQAGQDDLEEFAQTVGYELTLCHDVDVASFKALSEEYTKDKNNVYYVIDRVTTGHR